FRRRDKGEWQAAIHELTDNFGGLLAELFQAARIDVEFDHLALGVALQRLVESEQATKVIREFMDRGLPFALVTSPETRSYVRMIIERLFATLPVLSHVELAKGIE
ncbi:hypothetical protein ACC771_12470, partial [Rhizobium ruizarguesonis]